MSSASTNSTAEERRLVEIDTGLVLQLKMIRRKLRLKQKDVAAQVGCSQSVISLIESFRQRTASRPLLERLREFVQEHGETGEGETA